MAPEEPGTTFHIAAGAHVLNAALNNVTCCPGENLGKRGSQGSLLSQHTAAHPYQCFRHFPFAQSDSSLSVCSNVLCPAIPFTPQGPFQTSAWGLSLPKGPAGQTKCLVAMSQACCAHHTESLVTIYAYL